MYLIPIICTSVRPTGGGSVGVTELDSVGDVASDCAAVSASPDVPSVEAVTVSVSVVEPVVASVEGSEEVVTVSVDVAST
jgi:hypothetical protein